MSQPILLTACLDRIRSAYNVGSIFRSADSAGFDKLYLCGYTICPPDPKLHKTALGAEETLAWEHHDTALACLTERKAQDATILCFETATPATSLFDYAVDQTASEICAVFGNEVDGLDQDLLDLADQVITIPHFGGKSSLNVASAAAVALYELKRQIETIYV